MKNTHLSIIGALVVESDAEGAELTDEARRRMLAAVKEIPGALVLWLDVTEVKK